MARKILAGLFTAIVILSSTLVDAGPSLNKRYAVKDYHKAPRAWRNIGRAPSDHVINLSIGLTQSNFKELEKQLYEGKLELVVRTVLMTSISLRSTPC